MTRARGGSQLSKGLFAFGRYNVAPERDGPTTKTAMLADLGEDARGAAAAARQRA